MSAKKAALSAQKNIPVINKLALSSSTFHEQQLNSCVSAVDGHFEAVFVLMSFASRVGVSLMSSRPIASKGAAWDRAFGNVDWSGPRGSGMRFLDYRSTLPAPGIDFGNRLF